MNEAIKKLIEKRSLDDIAAALEIAVEALAKVHFHLDEYNPNSIDYCRKSIEIAYMEIQAIAFAHALLAQCDELDKMNEGKDD